MIIKEPYELSLWEDSPSTLQEFKALILGADTMTSQDRALDVKFTCDVNGTHQLTFKMYYQYYDSQTGELTQNLLTDQIFNESKIKLHYHDEWYDLVIKNVVKNSNDYSYTYTAQDLFIQELSKTGYNLEFSDELENNMKPITELVAQVLEGTDWQVNENSDVIVQTQKELIFEGTLAAPMQYRKLLRASNGAVVVEDTSSVIPTNTKVYFFYSDLATKEKNYQILVPNSSTISLDSDRVMLDATQYRYYGSYNGWGYSDTYDLYYPSILSSAITITTFQGEKYIFSQETKIDTKLKKILSRYSKTNDQNTYWGFIDTDYSSPSLIRNFVSNPNNYQSTVGWRVFDTGTPEIPSSIQLDSNPSIIDRIINGNSLGAETFEPVLKISLSNSGYLFNTGLRDNRSFLKELNKGDKYVFYYKGSTALPTFTLKFQEITYTEQGEYNLGDTYLAVAASSVSANQYNTIIGEIDKSLSYKDSKNKTLAIIIIPDGEASFNLTDFQVFHYVNYQGRAMLPTDTQVESTITHYYCYFKQEDNLNYTSINDLKYEKYNNSVSDYIPVMRAGCEKVRSINAKESNRFNIIQDLCETFECWASFDIAHDSIGRSGAKVVTIHQYIGQDNPARFLNGVNLKSTSRTFDSNQLVTKLIVKPNSNEYADGGFCTIATATPNPSGETTILNFDYYINQQLLDAETLVNDWYNVDENSSGMGYLTELKRINNRLIPLNIELSKLVVTIAQAEARVEKAQAGIESCVNLIDDINTTLLKYWKTDLNGLRALTPKESPSDPDGLFEQLQGIVYDIEHDIENSIQNKTLVEQMVKGLECQRNQIQFTSELADANTLLTRCKSRKAAIEIEQEELIANKKELDAEFFQRYHRFIQEGTWIDEKYTDDDLYFYDARSIGYESAMPKVTYQMNVIDVAALPQFNNHETGNYNLGSSGKIVGNHNSNLRTNNKWALYSSGAATKRFTQDDFEGVEIGLNWNGLIIYADQLNLVPGQTYTASFMAYANTSNLPLSFLVMMRQDGQRVRPYPTLPISIMGSNYITAASRQVTANTALTPTLYWITFQWTQELADYTYGNNTDVRITFQGWSGEYDDPGRTTTTPMGDRRIYMYAPKIEIGDTPTIWRGSIEEPEENLLSPYTFKVGDRTYVQDPEFFGYTVVNNIKTPAKEGVTVSKIVYSLDNPSSTTITIQTYKNLFQDLFQRVTATVQQVHYATGQYEKAAALAEAETAQKVEFLQDALNDAATILSNSADETVVWDNTGITITNSNNTSEKLRIVSGGILLGAPDATGQTAWKVGITAKGVSANLLTSGQLNTGVIQIMSSDEPTFRWDALGLTAFDYTTNANMLTGINSTRGVRFDRLGIYGFIGVDGSSWHPSQTVDWTAAPTGDPTNLSATSIRKYSFFELTKEGLYLDLSRINTTYGHGLYQTTNMQTLATEYKIMPLLSSKSHGQRISLGKTEDIIYNAWVGSQPYYSSSLPEMTNPIFTKVFSVKDSNSNEKITMYDDGTLVAKRAIIEGTITASSGHIGGSNGWVISSGKLYGTYTDNGDKYMGLYLNSTKGATAFYAGATSSTGANAVFKVTNNGKLTATGVDVSGIVNAESGIFNQITVTLRDLGDQANLGMWHVGNPRIDNNRGSDPDRYFYTFSGSDILGNPGYIIGFQKPNTGGSKAMVIGATNFLDWSTGKFYVDYQGNLTCADGHFLNQVTTDYLSCNTFTNITPSVFKVSKIIAAPASNPSTSTPSTYNFNISIEHLSGAKYRIKIIYYTSITGKFVGGSFNEKDFIWYRAYYINNNNTPVYCTARNITNDLKQQITAFMIAGSPYTYEFMATLDQDKYTNIEFCSQMGLSTEGISIDRLGLVNGSTPQGTFMEGSFLPIRTNINSTISPYTLGNSDNIWTNVYAQNTPVSSSDRREKQNISLLSSSYDSFFDALRPSTYQWLNESITHTGFIAQEVADALAAAHLSPSDFYGYRDENPDSLGLAYSEFISLNTWQIQKLKKRVADLEARCSLLEQKLLNQN